MRIALVHDWLTGMRGGEKCLEVLCRRFPDARLFTLLHVSGSTSATIDQMRITTSFLQRLPGVRRHYRWLLPLMPAAVERLKIPGDVDLVVSLSHAVAKGVQPPPGVPHVCYCLTPMRYAWHRRDDYFVASGRFLKTPISTARNAVLDWIRQWDRATSDRVTHFVAISRTVARRIAESYGRPSRVIYPPVDTEFFTPAGDSQQPAAGIDVRLELDARLGPDKEWLGSSGASPQEPGPTGSPTDAPHPYASGTAAPREDMYLCVSALVPYKRIDLAIEACNRLRRRLVVIGSGPEERRLGRLAGPTVTLAGWCTDHQIRNHFRRARALLFPANEDFGIVPLEAQACGTPVVVFGQGGATETVLPADESRPGTGLLFDEQTPESLARAIQRLEDNPHWFSPQLARQQAERFAAERFERELVGYLEEIVGTSPTPGN